MRLAESDEQQRAPCEAGGQLVLDLVVTELVAERACRSSLRCVGVAAVYARPPDARAIWARVSGLGGTVSACVPCPLVLGTLIVPDAVPSATV